MLPKSLGEARRSVRFAHFCRLRLESHQFGTVKTFLASEKCRGVSSLSGYCTHGFTCIGSKVGQPMKIGPALIGFGILTAFYVTALFYLDRGNHVFEHGIDLAFVLPQAAVFALVSFLLRFARWRWLLGRRGFEVSWWRGLAAYLSGFALTASPGKVGELLRIRYFGAMAVSADQVIACFVFERMMDLIAVSLLSILLVNFLPQLAAAFAFVAIVFAAVIALSWASKFLASLAEWLQDNRRHETARFLLAVGKGLSGAMSFFRPLEFTGSLGIGLAAWSIQSLGCVYLLAKLDIAAPPIATFAVYPFALLIGAASMLPGGIGTTETAIVVLLHGFGVPLERAALAAIGMRLSTLWFAMALGFLAILFLEFGHKDKAGKTNSPMPRKNS